ncbi:MAG: hypothetical protein J0L61_09720 [Planctomycetes bacterium]|nr:hypothetical protein [Planctomycetota bacterium]
MNGTGSGRNGLALGVIVFAGLAGFSVLVLEPLRSGRDEAMANFERMRVLAAESGAFAAKMPVLTSQQAEVKRSSESLTQRSRMARDMAGLMSAVQAIADKHTVQVERTLPRDIAASIPAPKADGALRPDAAVSVSIDATGTYAGLSAFVRDLQRGTGLTRLLSVRFTPEAQDADLVRASIVTAHFSFPKPAPAALSTIPGQTETTKTAEVTQ